jgi:hypothetical protein
VGVPHKYIFSPRPEINSAAYADMGDLYLSAPRHLRSRQM